MSIYCWSNVAYVGLMLILNPLSPHDALKHHFTSLKVDFKFPTSKGFGMKISMKQVYQCMVIFFNF